MGRNGFRNTRDLVRVEFEGHGGPEPAIAVDAVDVGPVGGADHGQVGAQDPVGVQARHVVERGVDRPGQPVDLRRSGRADGQVVVERCRVEPRAEQGGQIGADPRVGDQHLLEIALGVGRSDLPQVPRVGTEERHRPPVETGHQHQGVEAVDLGLVVPHGDERPGEPFPDGRQLVLVGQQGAREPEPEIVDAGRGPVGAADLVGPLVDDLGTQALQHRQHPRQGDRPAGDVQLQAPVLGRVRRRDGEPEGEIVRSGEGIERPQVHDRVVDLVVLLVGLVEGFAVPGQGGRGVQFLVAADDGLDQAVLPGADRGPQGPGEIQDAGVIERHRVGLIRDHGEVHRGQQRVTDAGGVTDVLALQRFHQHPLHGQAGVGGVAVARQVHQDGGEAAERIGLQVRPEPAPAGELQDSAHGVQDEFR